MFSRFIYLVAYVKISFLSIAEYYSIMCISHILFIHSSVEEHLSCSDFLAIVNKAAMILGITDICSNSGYIGVEFLDHVVSSTLSFLRIAKLCSTVAPPFYIPIGKAGGFQFLHILTNAYYVLSSLFVFNSHPPRYEVVFACIFDRG
jgi:hypothetical protein